MCALAFDPPDDVALRFDEFIDEVSEEEAFVESEPHTTLLPSVILL